MKKLLRKIRAGALAVIVLSTSMFSGCFFGQNEKDGNVKLWTAPSYVKVYQDIDYSTDEEFSGFYADNSLDVSMFINEKEGGQIILTPDYDVENYTVTVSDLVSSSGEKIGKDKITVYNQKYVDVTTPSASHTNSTLGMCPDALLPFEKAVEYGENKIDESKNQGIYLEIDSKGVSAGEYVGNVKVSVGEKAYDVAFTVTVWDAEVSEENHLKSSFVLRDQELLANEKDSTVAMYQKYYEQFLDYRLNVTMFTRSFDGDTYIEGLRKYFDDPRISSLHFPRLENSAHTSYDFDRAQEWFTRIAELCFEDGKNYYDKLYYYLAIIDEPHITNTTKKVVPIYKGLAVARHTAMRELKENRTNYAVSDELFNAVIDGIDNFPFLLTSSYNENYTYEKNKLVNTLDDTDVPKTEPDPDEEYVITWVPYMSVYDTEVDADKHRNEGIEEWWYGCNYPTNPYPTYHLDDNILTARVFSWMSYEHNVVGNLYWRVNWASEQNAFGVSSNLEDPYDITNLSQPTNGEGLLVYPGNPYGIEGFVPSLRLIAIRDGMEEYEILRSTGEKCKAIAGAAGYENFDVNRTFSKLYSALYVGTRVTGSADDFTAARELLSNFAIFAEKGTLIADVENTPFTTIVKVFVSNGTLKIDGKEADFVQKENGKEYSVEIKQDKAANYLNFTLEQEGESTDFEMFIGGEKKTVDISQLTFGSNQKVNDITSQKNSDGSVSVTLGELKTKEDGSVFGDGSHSLYLSGKLIAETFKKSKGITSIVIELENEGEAFDLFVRYTGTRESYKGREIDFIQKRIEANGTTLITIDVSTLAWDFGAIDEFRFYLGYADGAQARAIKIKTIVTAH